VLLLLLLAIRTNAVGRSPSIEGAAARCERPHRGKTWRVMLLVVLLLLFIFCFFC
jgi:hypothetical protein